jgi:hypothetical protein
MIPKFSKVEIMLIDNQKNKGLPSKERLEFFDCGLMITGDYIIVTIDTKEGLAEPNVSLGKIFHLNKIEAYKTTSY